MATPLQNAAAPQAAPMVPVMPVVSVLSAVLQRRGRAPHQLVQVLREVQAELGWLPREALVGIATALGRRLADVEAVASFYRFFHLQPVGRYRLLFSDAVSDRHLGSRALAEELCRLLWLEPGRVSPDGRVSVDFTSCTGWPDQGPALLVNHHQVITRLDRHRVRELAELIRQDVPVAQWPAEWFAVEPNIRRAGPMLGAHRPYVVAEVLARAQERGAAGVLAEVEAAGLRGAGGAGYPAGRKWRDALNYPPPLGGSRVIACNADEGEPGTFKDRVLLMTQADAVIDGMIVAALAVQARTGLIYLRGEYRLMLEELEALLARRRAAGTLGAGILGQAGWDFDITLHLGAGAYVCGEESAMLESLEGRRGQPRIRPPYPSESGYLGQPTVVHNVETLVAAAHIARWGAPWWRSLGTAESPGTKLHSVAGDCAHPGVYEFEQGVTVHDVLQACGADRTQAVQIGGPSGLCLAPQDFDRRICIEDVPTTGAFTVFDDTRDLFEVARAHSHFFAHESCGLCTPCRVGTELVCRRMDKLAAGRGSLPDEQELGELEALMHGSTHCALGATATNPLRDTLKRFPAAYQSRLRDDGWHAGFSLDAELAPARLATGRDDAHAHLPD